MVFHKYLSFVTLSMDWLFTITPRTSIYSRLSDRLLTVSRCLYWLHYVAWVSNSQILFRHYAPQIFQVSISDCNCKHRFSFGFLKLFRNSWIRIQVDRTCINGLFLGYSVIFHIWEQILRLESSLEKNQSEPQHERTLFSSIKQLSVW